MIKRNCAICGKEVTRYRSHIKSKNVFCSRKHKEKGMILGLVAPMRLGTGNDWTPEDIIRKRKYYKYRKFDKDRGYKTVNVDVNKFRDILKNGECYYCGKKSEIGFDRIDNSKGHTIGNVVLACNICNMTRGNRFTVEQMKKIGELIKTFNIK